MMHDLWTSDGLGHLRGAKGELIADYLGVHGEERARRACAEHNFCRGSSTDDLERLARRARPERLAALSALARIVTALREER